mmetsp:Transcript_104136/g.293149  ORF Transcript_104136/g.293149 Transcript_104136/m.293149 type:complete len:214 (+) Transcript_104136:81-722(+)
MPSNNAFTAPFLAPDFSWQRPRPSLRLHCSKRLQGQWQHRLVQQHVLQIGSVFVAFVALPSSTSSMETGACSRSTAATSAWRSAHPRPPSHCSAEAQWRPTADRVAERPQPRRQPPRPRRTSFATHCASCLATVSGHRHGNLGSTSWRGAAWPCTTLCRHTFASPAAGTGMVKRLLSCTGCLGQAAVRADPPPEVAGTPVELAKLAVRPLCSC